MAHGKTTILKAAARCSPADPIPMSEGQTTRHSHHVLSSTTQSDSVGRMSDMEDDNQLGSHSPSCCLPETKTLEDWEVPHPRMGSPSRFCHRML